MKTCHFFNGWSMAFHLRLFSSTALSMGLASVKMAHQLRKRGMATTSKKPTCITSLPCLLSYAVESNGAKCSGQGYTRHCCLLCPHPPCLAWHREGKYTLNCCMVNWIIQQHSNLLCCFFPLDHQTDAEHTSWLSDKFGKCARMHGNRGLVFGIKYVTVLTVAGCRYSYNKPMLRMMLCSWDMQLERRVLWVASVATSKNAKS